MYIKSVVENKKILGHHNKVAKWLFNYFLKNTKQPPEMFDKKAVLLKRGLFTPHFMFEIF